jgi:hypothetical protein
LSKEFKLKGEDTLAGGLDKVDIKLITTIPFVDGNPTMDRELFPRAGERGHPLGLSAKEDAFDPAFVVSQGEIDMTGAGGECFGDFTFDPEVGQEVVRFDEFADVRGEEPD